MYNIFLILLEAPLHMYISYVWVAINPATSFDTEQIINPIYYIRRVSIIFTVSIF